ncbi:hypothetical protein AGMMS49936_04880 [Endomicrobiia bacterium]|nr:hypothetical protein AGMMS49936_04880 [Endomicrobiia bacterium]
MLGVYQIKLLNYKVLDLLHNQHTKVQQKYYETKKKAVRSYVMDLVLMGVKKAFDKRVKDSKERRKEEKRKDRARR